MARKRTRKITQDGISAEYKRACGAIKKADARFNPIVVGYRNGSIDEATFLKERALNDVAQKRFDVAFAKEAGRKD